MEVEAEHIVVSIVGQCGHVALDFVHIHLQLKALIETECLGADATLITMNAYPVDPLEKYGQKTCIPREIDTH